MAHQIDDRWLWLGLGVAAFFAVKGIQHALKDIVRMTEIDPYQYEPKKKKTDFPEDKLTIQELTTLANSPHPNIANAAISLILSRFGRLPHGVQMVSKDLASKDPNTRQRANTAVHFLRYNGEILMDDRRGLPISPPGYATPTRWSDGSRTPSDGGYVTIRGTLGDLVDEGGVIVPSIEDPVAGWESVPREREGDGGGEDGEVEVRRRRREAMVLHEGGGAVTGSDIIRPRETG